MKEFVRSISVGGMPISNEDLVMLQHENGDAIKAVLGCLDAQTQGVILSGLVATINGANISVTPGIVYLNGQMMRFAAYNGPSPCYVVAANPLIETREFEDVTTHEATVETIAIRASAAPSSGQYILIDGITSRMDLKRALGISDAIETLGTKADKLESDFNTDSSYCNYRKDNAGFIHLIVRFYSTGNDALTTYTLPPGFRPSTALNFSALCFTFIEGDVSSQVAAQLPISIATNGVISAGTSIPNKGYYSGTYGYFQFKAA